MSRAEVTARSSEDMMSMIVLLKRVDEWWLMSDKLVGDELVGDDLVGDDLVIKYLGLICQLKEKERKGCVEVTRTGNMDAFVVRLFFINIRL